MTSQLYNLIIKAVSDYLGTLIELGKNASNFYNNGVFIIRLWSEDEMYVWVISVVPVSENRYYHAFFNLYKKEDAPDVMETRIKMQGLLDSADIHILLDEKKLTYQFRRW